MELQDSYPVLMRAESVKIGEIPLADLASRIPDLRERQEMLQAERI
jgi:hypothetical protein